MKVRVESSHKANEVPGRPEKVQPHLEKYVLFQEFAANRLPSRKVNLAGQAAACLCMSSPRSTLSSPTANLGIRQFREKTARRAPCGMVGKTTHGLVTTFYTYLHPTPHHAEVPVTSVPDCPWITLHEVLHWIALGEVRDISSRRAELEAVYDRVNAGEPDSGTNIERRFAEAERRLLYALQAGKITATGKEQIMLDVTAMNTALSARREISALWWLDAKFDVDKSIAYWPKRSIPETCQVEELRFPRQVVMALWALTAVPEAAPFPNDATPYCRS